MQRQQNMFQQLVSALSETYKSGKELLLFLYLQGMKNIYRRLSQNGSWVFLVEKHILTLDYHQQLKEESLERALAKAVLVWMVRNLLRSNMVIESQKRIGSNF